MKIKTETFRRFSNPIISSYVKGDVDGENLYLNFEDSCAYFSNAAAIAKLKFNFEVQDQRDDDIENIMVDKQMFIAMCFQYEELVLTLENGKYIFSYEEEKFDISPTIRKESFPDFNYDDFKTYQMTSGILRNIRAASQYMGAYAPDENYFGVGLLKKSIVGTDAIQVFEAKVGDNEEEFPTIKIAGEVVKIVLNMAEEEVCHINYNETTDELYFTFGDNKELSVASAQVGNLNIPDLEDPKFISKYHHDTTFTIEKEALVDVLEFFSVFVKNERNERLFLHVKNETVLSVEAQAASKGNRDLVLKECSPELIEDGFWVPRVYILKAIKSIEDDFVTFEVKTDGKAFNIIGESNQERHVATPRLK